MNRETSLKPVLCIDLKKNRIRIHKLTLHMLGDPEYIQLLVNPQDSMIAIKKSVRKDYLAHRVRYSKADSRYCYELYSTELLQAFNLFNANSAAPIPLKIVATCNLSLGILVLLKYSSINYRF